MTSPIRILLAEDLQIVRAGIRRLLDDMSEVAVVAEAGDGRTAIEMTTQLRPNFVMIGARLPELNGFDAAAHIRRHLPKVRILILSEFADEESVAQALRAGASGHLSKNVSVVELETAIRTVASGGTYFAPGIDQRLQRRLLTPRQREILQSIAEGRNTKEIANLLHVSVKTIESHRQGLMQRLDIHNVPGLVRYAIRLGLVRV